MAAHRALSFTVVLNEIFEWYHGSYFSMAFYPGISHCSEEIEGERQRTLAHAARVSKSFKEAAVRVLWNGLNSLYPIFKLLPSFHKVGEHLGSSASDSYQVFLVPEDVPEHEWDHLLEYTVHVRSLSLWGNLHADKRLASASWAGIRRFAQRRQLVPNLSSLRWIVELPELTAMLLFLPPSVEMLDVFCDSTATDPGPETRARWTSCLERLVKESCERNPRLTDLSFEFKGECISPSSVMPHLTPLQSLVEFSVASDTGSVDLAHVHTLAAMSALERLALPSLAGIPSGRLSDPSGGFRSLHTLRLKHHGASASVFASATLKELSIENYTYRDESLLRQSCAMWARAFPSLTHFYVWAATEVKEDVEPRHALAPAIAPLFALRALESMRFNYGTYVPVFVRDADVAAISGAWPLLKKLSVVELVLGSDFPSCTVGVLGLLAVARNCPALEELSLTRVVLRREEAHALPPDTLDHGLQTLRVYYGMTEETHRVIADKLFPHLQSKPEN